MTPALAFDCSGKSISVAIIGDGRTLAEEFFFDDKEHSTTLMPAIEKVCDNSRLTIAAMSHIAFTTGPGSFTSLRIAAATAKSFALALGTPLVGISTLHALALNIVGVADICPIIDARGGFVYGALYQSDGKSDLAVIGKERLIHINDLLNEMPQRRKIIFLGDGARTHREAIKNTLGANAIFAKAECDYPRAGNIGLVAAKLFTQGILLDPFSFVPSYLLPSYLEPIDKTSGNTP